MIVVLTKIYTKISQCDYDKIIKSVSYDSLKCIHCKDTGMHYHGLYKRGVKNADDPEKKTTITVTRVRCNNKECGRTHALLLGGMVPYSQIELMDTVEILTAESSDELNEIMDENPHINPIDIYLMRKKYKMYWEQYVGKKKLGAITLYDLVISCAEKYNKHFMQIYKTLCSIHIIQADPPSI